ncbi:hypothetical protein NDU88_000205 [Pleurodeles waltl]|uniref:Uncharacterized protein n=1 Tax=Pleurodeles waltl TaxID=8319 RepID=A0AAV7TEZ7_PLEWA|nr:hypothetical protein NDU88_000205 [Pleurodeles waltl]
MAAARLGPQVGCAPPWISVGVAEQAAARRAGLKKDDLGKETSAGRSRHLSPSKAVPEGVEEDDLKKRGCFSYKKTMTVEESEAEIMKDIQRIHRDPFRRDLNKKNPLKRLVNIQTYQLKEKILVKALWLGPLKVEEF